MAERSGCLFRLTCGEAAHRAQEGLACALVFMKNDGRAPVGRKKISTKALQLVINCVIDREGDKERSENNEFRDDLMQRSCLRDAGANDPQSWLYIPIILLI